MAAMSSQAPMNKMMEKLMDKPAHHRWLACQCIMLDKNIVVKTSSSFRHLPQPPQPPPPPPPQCKKRPRPPPKRPAPPKVAKTQHGEAADEMVDVEVEESPEDKEAADEKKAKEADKEKEVVKEKEMVKEKESEHGEGLMQDDPKVLEMNLVKC